MSINFWFWEKRSWSRLTGGILSMQMSRKLWFRSSFWSTCIIDMIVFRFSNRSLKEELRDDSLLLKILKNLLQSRFIMWLKEFQREIKPQRWNGRQFFIKSITMHFITDSTRDGNFSQWVKWQASLKFTIKIFKFVVEEQSFSSDFALLD